MQPITFITFLIIFSPLFTLAQSILDEGIKNKLTFPKITNNKSTLNNGYFISNLTQQGWVDSEYVNGNLYIYNYGEYNRIIEVVGKLWNSNLNSWMDNFIRTYYYDDSANTSTELISTYGMEVIKMHIK